MSGTNKTGKMDNVDDDDIKWREKNGGREERKENIRNKSIDGIHK